MAFPGFTAWCEANPDSTVSILAKKSVAGIWDFCSGLEEVISYTTDKQSQKETVAYIRSKKYDEVIMLPHTFRIACLMWRSRIPVRRGTLGQFRNWFITDAVKIKDLAKAHQGYEYMSILGVQKPNIPSPSSAIDFAKINKIPTCVDSSDSIVVLPAAARGDSKQWPTTYFAEAVKIALDKNPDLNVLVCGTPTESEVCAEVTNLIGGKAQDISGKTKLPELAAIMSKARLVCCNDSGGMHLATAMGVPVVAIFGITDPKKTGPLGTSRVVAADGVKVSRAIPRTSPVATKALRSITPQRVASSILDVLRQ